MSITQRDLASACCVFQPVIFGWLRAMGVSHRIDEEVALMTIVVAQLRLHGVPGPAAVKIVGNARDYVRFVLFDQAHQAWLAIFDDAGAQYSTVSLSTSHLASVMESKPVCLVVALHEVVGRASRFLQEMLAQKEAA